MYMCTFMYVCVHVRVRAHMYLGVCVCACVRVCTRTHMCVYTSMFMYACVTVCMYCMCVELEIAVCHQLFFNNLAEQIQFARTFTTHFQLGKPEIVYKNVPTFNE